MNITEDSFSDGGRYLEAPAAIEHGRRLLEQGADLLDLGAASSNPDANPVSAAEEIERLRPVLSAFPGSVLSVDSFQPVVQRAALQAGVCTLNDIHGFQHPELYAEFAASGVRLIVMHAVQSAGIATRVAVPAAGILARVRAFFDLRLEALFAAGIRREQIVIDPGMGFFLGSEADASTSVLRALPELKSRYGLPICLSVSRKSFLGTITGKQTAQRGAATLAAELFAVSNGADYVRTHDVGALKDALAVWDSLSGST